MLYVNVELWPYGDESKKKKIAEAYIANTGTGDGYYGNYKYELIHNVDKQSKVEKGFLFGHNRKQGVWALIRKILEEASGRG